MACNLLHGLVMATTGNPSVAHAQTIDRAVDATLIWFAAGIAARAESSPRIVAFGLAATMLWWFASRVVRQYDATNGRGFVGDLALTFVMLGIVIGPLWLSRSLLVHSGVVQTFALLLVPSLLLSRAYIIGSRLHAYVDTVLIVGSGALARLTGKELEQGDRRLLGYLRFDDEVAHHLHAPVLGTVNDLEEVFKEQVVDEVYLAPTATEHASDVQRAIATCERFGVPFALPVCSYRLTRAKPVCDETAGDGFAHFLSVKRKPLQLWLKRLFDICASGIALFLLSPLLVSTALTIKATSRGPILFRQERVGLHGRTFGMLKFRSMVADAEALKLRLMAQNEQSGPVFKMKRDPRITAVGRFIRKFSIDELPQLVNVLRGDMSIVGPRPPIPSEVRKYEAWQRRRLSVRPGLTCVWQVSGRNEIGFRDWMLLDMRYIDHWSLLHDFQLILRTFPVVLTGRGAS